VRPLTQKAALWDLIDASQVVTTEHKLLGGESMGFSDIGVVPYGLLVMQAMDIYRVKTCPPAPFKPPPAAKGTIIGYLMGIDTVLLNHPQFSPGPLIALGHTVCYGTVTRTQRQ
jgi:hypothetical protein